MNIHTSILTLQSGMYILRQPQDGMAPLTVTRAPGGGGTLDTLATPGCHGTTLRNSSDCIVVRVAGGMVDMLVTAYLEKADDPVPVLQLDQIRLGPAMNAPVPATVALPAIRIPAQGISLIGHIERKGDQVAVPGDQLGDPSTNLRLEGFQVMWPDRPDGVDLVYSIAIEGAGALPSVQTGKFCGARGASQRITDVTFSLVGPQADHYQLQGTAYFSGGFQLAISSALPLSGPSGLEHLTALTLTVSPASPAPANPWHASAHTRVFKAKVAPLAKPVKAKSGARKRSAATATGK